MELPQDGIVVLRISQLLDLPKPRGFMAGTGSYVIRAEPRSGKPAEPNTIVETEPVYPSTSTGGTDDIKVDQDLVLRTASPDIKVTVLRVGALSSDVVGEAKIHRLDPRGREVTPYELSMGKECAGGIELMVIERPPERPMSGPQQSAGAAHLGPAGLVPQQHDVLALIKIDKLVGLPASTTAGNEIELWLEPVDPAISPAQAADMRKVLGAFLTQPEPKSRGARFAKVADQFEYVGIYRADRGGMTKVRLSVHYRGLMANAEVGHCDLDVTFESQPVSFHEFATTMPDGRGVFVGHQLVSRSAWEARNRKKEEAAAQADKVFPAKKKEQASGALEELQKSVQKLEQENKLLMQKLESQDDEKGARIPNAFDEVMADLGPPPVSDPPVHEVVGPGQTRPMRFRSEGAIIEHRTFGPGMSKCLYVPVRVVAGSLQHVETMRAEQFVRVEDVDPLTLPDRKWWFKDLQPTYNVSEDVWGLVQPEVLDHFRARKPKPNVSKHRPVRYESILA